jgi:hypothetical protein
MTKVIALAHADLASFMFEASPAAHAGSAATAMLSVVFKVLSFIAVKGLAHDLTSGINVLRETATTALQGSKTGH